MKAKETWLHGVASCLCILVLTVMVIASGDMYEKYNPQYIGWCDRVDFGGQDAYWSHDRIILAALAQEKDDGGNVWWIARIEGTHSFALFAVREDAIAWITDHKYVKVKP